MVRVARSLALRAKRIAAREGLSTSGSANESPFPTPSRQWAFYKAGNFYIIETFPKPSGDGVIRIRHAPLIALRSDLPVVGVQAT